jgi:hypothetical protein
METLGQIVQETVERLAVNYRDASLGEDDLRSTDVDVVLLHNIRADIRLASRASALLLQALLELRAAHETLWNDTAADGARTDAIETARHLSLDFELHLRQLYELLDAIRLLIGKLSKGAARPPDEVMEELSRLRHFRDLLVVHKDKAVRPMRSITGGRYDGLDVRIGGSLKPIGNEDSARLRAIFERTSAKLPAGDRDEANYNAQLQLLYEHFPQVSKRDLGEVKRLIARNGVQSDRPIVLARVVLALAATYYAGT